MRLAIEQGLDLVPGFCFGEKWVHDLVLLPAPLRRQLYRRFRLAGALLIGRWGTFLGKVACTDGAPLSLGYVWGAPIPVTRQTEPTAAYIAEVHAAYVAEVCHMHTPRGHTPRMHTPHATHTHMHLRVVSRRLVQVRRIFDTYKSRFGYDESETLELVSAKLAKGA